MELLKKYFPSLSNKQLEQYNQLCELYPEWNEKINVISRKDIDNLLVNHILHSLSIAKAYDFKVGSKILDLGTGGGFPGIPLAIFYPQCQFHLVDRVGKKLKVAEDIAQQIGLTNITFQHGDVKEVKGKYDFIVSRAVAPLQDLISLSHPKVSSIHINAVPNGLICLKGGDLSDELKIKDPIMITELKDYFDEDYFSTKKIIYVQL